MELVNAAIDGDKRAFSRLLASQAAQAYPVALAILDNRHDAEDAVQRAMAAALNSLPGLRNPRAFRAWFRRIVTNQALGIQRKRRNDLPLDGSIHNVASMPVDHEQSMDILAAIEALPDPHREAILLYFSGLKTREMANVLGRPHGTATRILSEAYSMLGAILGPDYAPRNNRHET